VRKASKHYTTVKTQVFSSSRASELKSGGTTL